jgi:hypothetical protein
MTERVTTSKGKYRGALPWGEYLLFFEQTVNPCGQSYDCQNKLLQIEEESVNIQ